MGERLHPDHRVLAQFCAELPALRQAVRQVPDRLAVLEQAVAAVQAGEPLTTLLRELGIAVSEPDGEAGDRGTPPWSTPWASAAGRSATGQYVCPLGLCLRAQDREPSGTLPMCHVQGQALTFTPGA